MTMKKYLLIALLLVGVTFVASSVFARDEGNNDKPKVGKGETRKLENLSERIENFELPDVESPKQHPSSLFIGPQGQTRIINGELTTLGNTTPAMDGVKVWGISLKVNMGNARFTPAGTTRSSLQVGDKVNIKGTIDQASGEIQASIVHALSARNRLTDDLLGQITKLIEKIRELQQKAGLPLTPLP